MNLIKTSKNTSFLPSMLSNFYDNNMFLRSRAFEREFDQSLPALNITEGTKKYVIELAAPGLKKSDFEISTEEGILTIRAEVQDEKTEENERFTRKEFSCESFCRSIRLPENSIPEKIDAKYEDGILKLSLPKREQNVNKVKKEIKIA